MFKINKIQWIVLDDFDIKNFFKKYQKILNFFRKTIDKSDIQTAEITPETAASFPADSSRKLIYTTSFEPSEGKKYQLRSEAELVKEGFNGTMALKIHRSDKKMEFHS